MGNDICRTNSQWRSVIDWPSLSFLQAISRWTRPCSLHRSWPLKARFTGSARFSRAASRVQRLRRCGLAWGFRGAFVVLRRAPWTQDDKRKQQATSNKSNTMRGRARWSFVARRTSAMPGFWTSKALHAVPQCQTSRVAFPSVISCAALFHRACGMLQGPLCKPHVACCTLRQDFAIEDLKLQTQRLKEGFDQFLQAPPPCPITLLLTVFRGSMQTFAGSFPSFLVSSDSLEAPRVRCRALSGARPPLGTSCAKRSRTGMAGACVQCGCVVEYRGVP
jgi:hypothetical protein